MRVVPLTGICGVYVSRIWRWVIRVPVLGGARHMSSPQSFHPFSLSVVSLSLTWVGRGESYRLPWPGSLKRVWWESSSSWIAMKRALVGESSPSAASRNMGKVAPWTPRGGGSQPGPECLLSNTTLKDNEITHLEEICFCSTGLMCGGNRA